MFLEVDLGTEALKVWQQKTASYLQLALSGEFLKKFRQPQFRVLVVANSERRLANIRGAISKSTDKIFWFTTFERHSSRWHLVSGLAPAYWRSAPVAPVRNSHALLQPMSPNHPRRAAVLQLLRTFLRLQALPARHPNPRNAEICSQCGSRELSTPHPHVPLWLAVLIKILATATRPAPRRGQRLVPVRRAACAASEPAADVPGCHCRPDALLPLVSVLCSFRTSSDDSFPNYLPVPNETIMDIKLPNSRIEKSSASAPKAGVRKMRKPARLRGFSAPSGRAALPAPLPAPTRAVFARTGGNRSASPAQTPACTTPNSARPLSIREVAELIGCFALDRKTDPHSPRASALPVHGQRQIDLLHEIRLSAGSKTNNKEEKQQSEPVQTRRRVVVVFLRRRNPPPVFNRHFQPQAGRNHRSQAQGGSQQPAFPDRRSRSEHDVRRTRRTVHRQRQRPPASSSIT